jgi:hypothetical protein
MKKKGTKTQTQHSKQIISFENLNTHMPIVILANIEVPSKSLRDDESKKRFPINVIIEINPMK